MPDPLWTSKEAARVTGGQIRGQWEVTGLSIDTRTLRPGDLFVPLKHQRDGHDFIPQAREAGAGAVMSEILDTVSPALIVNDSLQGLHALAVAARDRSSAIRIAITGSVGKTSVKEAIAHICQSQGLTHKSQKSYNNHWGAPLTLASMPANSDYGVFELGMNHAGELADLSPMIAPHIAVITKIAPAHLANFGSIAEIADAKAEIFQGLQFGGIAVLNRDDEYYDHLVGWMGHKNRKIISFGYHPQSDIQIINPQSFANQQIAQLKSGDQSIELSLALTGRHWLENAACAVAATHAAGIAIPEAIARLAHLKPLSGRGERLKLQLNNKSVTLLDESYNANPASMRAALTALSVQTGRKLVVLGDMFELGRDELAMHSALADPIVEAGISRVIFVGECMRALKGALPQPLRGVWARDWEGALQALSSEVEDGDVILVKGSNATGLSQLVATIKSNQMEAASVL